MAAGAALGAEGVGAPPAAPPPEMDGTNCGSAMEAIGALSRAVAAGGGGAAGGSAAAAGGSGDSKARAAILGAAIFGAAIRGMGGELRVTGADGSDSRGGLRRDSGP